jgi:hypothetical protein
MQDAWGCRSGAMARRSVPACPVMKHMHASSTTAGSHGNRARSVQAIAALDTRSQAATACEFRLDGQLDELQSFVVCAYIVYLHGARAMTVQRVLLAMHLDASPGRPG